MEDKYHQAIAESKVTEDDAAVKAAVDKILAENLKENMNEEVYKFLFNCIDLTTLRSTDSPRSVADFVERVNDFDNEHPEMKNVAAICVYPNFSQVVRTVLEVSGVDLLDKTPIYDIKPYLPYADAHPQASGGFASDPNEGVLIVDCDDEVLERLGDDATAVLAALARDPRPAYHDDPERVYEMRYGSWTVCFSVDGDTLTVHSVE